MVLSDLCVHFSLMKNKIKTIFFDAGNTLIFPDYFVIQKVLGEFGIKATVAKIRQAEYEALAESQKEKGTQSWKVYFGIWLKMAGAHEENVKNIYADLWGKHRQKNLWSLVEESAVETLAELKKRQYKLGVISNSDGGIEKLLTDCGLAKYFDAIVDSSAFGIRKPDVKIFEFALKEIKADAGESLFVGDSYEIDILGAENAGLTAMFYDPLKKYDHLPCTKINKLSELLPLL